MYITCPYCDSYVEATENRECPECGAPLGKEVEAELKKAEEREAEERAQAQAEAEEREREETIEKVVSGLGTVAASVLGSAVMGGMMRGGSKGPGHMPPPGGFGDHGPGGPGGMPF